MKEYINISMFLPLSNIAQSSSVIRNYMAKDHSFGIKENDVHHHENMPI